MEIFAACTLFLITIPKYRFLCGISTTSCEYPWKGYSNVGGNTFITKQKAIVNRILKKRPYIPTVYCIFDYHGQLQTSVQFLVRNIYLHLIWIAKTFGLRPPLIKYHRELFTLNDGGIVALDWATAPSLDSHPKYGDIFQPNTSIKGVVIICHGLAGDSQSEYIVFQTLKLLQENYDVVVINARGTSGVPIVENHFGSDVASDIHEIIEDINKRLNCLKIKMKLFLIGYSLGGAHVLRYLQQLGERENCGNVIEAAVCISPLWDAKKVTKVFSLWSMLFGSLIKALVVCNRDFMKILNKLDISAVQVLSCRNLTDLDTLLVHTYGYKSVAEYHEAISPAYNMQSVAVPTLAISSLDDPVCSSEGIPSDSLRGSGVIVVKTNLGGHLAFPVYDGRLFSTCWTDDVTVDWICEHNE